MTESYSPNLFLFQSYVGQVLKEGKKIIKTAPFEGIDPEALINNNKNQYIDAFHQYFLAAMGHSKTREMTCSNYEKLIRQGLVDKQHLPPSLISSVLAACAGAGVVGGGSTSGSSSLGSASLSSAPQGHSLYIGNMIKTMLLSTCQPSSELVQGLNYLLQGTHKKNAILYNSMLQQIYNSLLVKYRSSPVKRFISSYLDMCIDEIQTHFDQQGYAFASRKLDPQSGKFQMATYKETNGYGKFGKCFSCRKQASHYVKEEWLPICGLTCRSNVKSLLFQCQANEYFNLMNWLLDCLPSGEQAILTFLFRELQSDASRNKISFVQIETILKTLIHLLVPKHIISRPLLGILSLIMTKWPTLVDSEQMNAGREQILQKYFKVYFLQILSIVEDVAISKQHLDSINFLAELMKDSNFLINLFLRYDSKFFEPSILARIFNLISQYAKKFEHSLQGLFSIVQSLTSRFIEKNIRQDDWEGYGQFLKKREIRDIIVTFNKKPMNGFKMLKKLLSEPLQQKIAINQPEKEREPDLGMEVSKQSLEMAIYEQTKEATQHIQQNEEDLRQHSIQQEQQKQEEENLELDQLQKQEQPLDSDLIINKRIDDMVEQHEEQSERSKEQTTQRESASNQISQQGEEEIQRSNKDHVSTPLKNKPQMVQEDRSAEKILSIQDISPSKNDYSMGPRQIAIFIRQNLELNSWSQNDNKLPIPIPSLNKSKIGQFFGADNPEVRKISLQFLNSFDFDRTEIDDVMRVVMNSFDLPKQTQQIQRIIGDLSVRLLGKYDLHDETGIYQYIYLLLMVQTTNHNPQVRQNEKLGLEQYLSMAKTLSGGGVPRERAEADFKRILSNSINVKKKYPNQTIFYQKHLPNNIVSQDFGGQTRGSLSRSILLYLWEYLVIGLVWPGNQLGLFEASLLMGREGLQEQQKGFFEALKKSMSEDSQRQILKLAIDYGNDLIGKPWDTVVKILYSMQQTQDCSTILDRLFTNSSKISPVRLKDFLHALLQFSSSEFQKDTSYTRELFVLRHINNLIEYNIERFNQLAHLCWPLLKNYFKDICLHPRKEICMSAIDSLKQLCLKLFKLRVQALPHQTLFQTFLYVFERSGLEMKDLIANVMLNLITADIRGGWDQIYSILDVLDTKDKQLVVKLIGRLIKEVGLQRLGNLQRLHSICIKELRVCGDANATDQLLSQLWDLSSFIDEPTTWLQTIRSIKDIFKISLNSQIINILVRLCNKCVSMDSRRSLDKQILAEVIDLLMFLLQIRGGATKLAALITSLDYISKLSPEFQLKYLIGNCGLLQIFRMFLGSEQKIAFSLFLKKTIKEIYLPHLKQAENDLQFEYLSYWCVHQFMNHLPIELLNLKQNDKDFEQTLTGLIASPQTVEKEKQHVLIQFPQSHKQYYQKSLLQLVFLDIVESIYANLQDRPQQKMQPLKQKIEVAISESFDCAFRVNRLILLRNFLWNNGFLIGRQLPGLLKQEHRSLLVAAKLFPFKKSYKMLKIYLKHYIETLGNIRKLKEINLAEPAQPKELKKQSKDSKNNDPKRDEGKVLIVYAHDASLWIRESEQGINQTMKCIREQIETQSEQILKPAQIEQLIEFLTALLQQKNLPQKVCRSSAQTLRALYSLKL